MILRVVQFLTVICAVLALIPAGAHFFELPHKIALNEAQYYAVQSIYRGWALFGFVLFAALIAELVSALLLRRQPKPLWLTLAAFACTAATLVIFFVWTYPANLATRNWTVPVANWEPLRRQWEYSHAAGAIFAFLAVAALILSLLATQRRDTVGART